MRYGEFPERREFLTKLIDDHQNFFPRNSLYQVLCWLTYQNIINLDIDAL
jgi:hypothetical protein